MLLQIRVTPSYADKITFQHAGSYIMIYCTEGIRDIRSTLDRCLKAETGIRREEQERYCRQQAHEETISLSKIIHHYQKVINVTKMALTISGNILLKNEKSTWFETSLTVI